MPAVPAAWEAEVGGRITLAQEVEAAVSHDYATNSQPGNRARLHLKK